MAHGGDRARPISLAPAPFSSNLVAFLLRPSGMSKYSAQFSEGGRVTHIVGSRLGRLFTAKSALGVPHLKCTRQILLCHVAPEQRDEYITRERLLW